jgi:hypothetical protein
LTFAVGNEIERRAATLLTMVEPNLFSDAEYPSAIGVVAVPTKVFTVAFVRLAPEFDAC